MQKQTKIACRNERKTGAAARGMGIAALFIAVVATSASAQRAAAATDKGATQLLQPSRPPLMARITTEKEHRTLGPLVASYQSVPHRVRLCQTSIGGKPCKVAVHQIGDSGQRQVLVLVHGVLSDHQVWRYVAGPLSEGYELWLVDLPGCGESDAPPPKSLGERGYSPTALAERVWQALEQCLAERETNTELRLIGHSLGGMVCAQMTGNPELRARYGQVLQQVRGMMLFAPAEFAINQENPIFAKIARLPGYQVEIAKALGVLNSAAAQADLDGVCFQDRLARETAQNLAHVLGSSAHRHAAQAMIRQAVYWNEKTHRPVWAENKRLESHYRNIDLPTLIIWGERDETLPASMGHKIKDLIPGARLVELPECMHSPQMECPDESVALIREFCGSNGTVASAR